MTQHNPLRDEPGVKDDKSKHRYDLLPVRPLEDLVTVLTYGANKYGDRNYEKGMSWSRPFAACMRHLWKWWSGENIDSESGLPHLAHAAASIFFLMEFSHTAAGTDNRVCSATDASGMPRSAKSITPNPMLKDMLPSSDFGYK